MTVPSGDLLLDTIDLRRKLDLMMPGVGPPQNFKEFIQELLQTTLPRLRKTCRINNSFTANT